MRQRKRERKKESKGERERETGIETERANEAEMKKETETETSLCPTITTTGSNASGTHDGASPRSPPTLSNQYIPQEWGDSIDDDTSQSDNDNGTDEDEETRCRFEQTQLDEESKMNESAELSTDDGTTSPAFKRARAGRTESLEGRDENDQ